MTKSKTQAGLLVAAIACSALAAPVQARADEHALDTSSTSTSSAQSFLQLEGVRSLGRLTRTQWIGKAPMVVTSGVRLYVPARAGISRESLAGLVRSDVSRAQQGPLAAAGLNVRVLSAQAGYIVELSLASPQDATDLVREIEASLLPPSAQR